MKTKRVRGYYRKSANGKRTHVKRYYRKPKNGCYVATCVYGSYDCPEVWTLRRFRDYRLDNSLVGKMFIQCYYFISPKVVKLFGNNKYFKDFCKNRLDRFVDKLNKQGIDNTEYIDKY